MNNRKIHTARCIPYESKLIIDEDTVVDVSYTIPRIFRINDSFKCSFARRQFAGAKRFIFKWDNDSKCFQWNPESVTFAWLCPDESRKILNIGKSTKEFSIWVHFEKIK